MAADHPMLHTSRLRLRQFTLDDAPIVQEYCADREVASTTLSLPHPYEPGMAEQWISRQAEQYASGTNIHFAITRSADKQLVGAIDLRINAEHQHAEMGYLIYRPFWRCGFATEAAQAVLDFGFQTLQLHRIYAHHMARNPASGRVLQKIGMKHEGMFPQHIVKWGEFEDIVHYGLLRTDWQLARSQKDMNQ